MKLEEKISSFNFVNNREYVHSSTIIDFIWKNIKQFFANNHKHLIFMDIKFHQELKKNAKIILFDEYQDNKRKQIRNRTDREYFAKMLIKGKIKKGIPPEK